jgi:hypothetical protein
MADVELVEGGVDDFELVPDSLMPGSELFVLPRPVDAAENPDDRYNFDLVRPAAGEREAEALEEKLLGKSPIERLNSMRIHFQLKDEAVDKALADGKLATAAKRPHPHRKPWSEATNNDSNFRWIMAMGPARGGVYPENNQVARANRVERLLSELTRHRDVVAYESWQITGTLHNLNDIQKIPDAWLTSPVAQSLPDYVPPRVMDDYAADIDTDTPPTEAAPAKPEKKLAAPRVVRSSVSRKTSKTLLALMTRFLEDSGLNEKQYSFIQATTDTSMLYKFVVFHIDGFYNERSLDQTLSNITELRNFVLFSMYNPFKSSATKWFQAVKTRVTQFYIQPTLLDTSINPDAFRTDQCIVWYVFLVRTPAAKRYQDERLTNASLFKAKQHAYRVYYPEVYEQLQRLIVPDAKGEIDMYNLVIYVQACTGFRLNEVFRPYIEVHPVDKRLQNIDTSRWIKQIGTSKAKEGRGDQFFLDDPAVKRWVIKPLAFLARSDRIITAVEAIRKVAKEKFDEKHIKDGRKYEDATAKELTVMFGQNLNRRMQKAFPGQAEFAASKGMQFGSHWNRSLYANVAYDQFQATLGHVSKAGFIADVLMHAPGNLDTAQRYSNMIVTWQLPQNLQPSVVKNLEQFKAFSDWATERIGTLEGVVKRVSDGSTLPTIDAVNGMVNIKDRTGRLVTLERLKHHRTRDKERRLAFVVEANEILQENNINPTTANFVALGVSAGFVTEWRKAYGTKLEVEDDDVRRGVVERSDALVFLTHVIQFTINPYSYMKTKWLAFHQQPLEALPGPPLELTQAELLDVARRPTKLERFYRMVYDVMDFFREEDRLQRLNDSKGLAWETMNKEDKYAEAGEYSVSNAIDDAVADRSAPASPFGLALRMYTERLKRRIHAQDIYPLLYLYGEDAPRPDLLAGAKLLKEEEDLFSRPFTVNPKTLTDLESGLSADEMKILDVKEISVVDLTRVAGLLERGGKIEKDRDFAIAAVIMDRQNFKFKQGKAIAGELLRKKRERLKAGDPAAKAEAAEEKAEHEAKGKEVAKGTLEALETHIGMPVKLVKWTPEDYNKDAAKLKGKPKSAMASKVNNRNNRQAAMFGRPLHAACEPSTENKTDVIRVDMEQDAGLKKNNELKLCVEVEQGDRNLKKRKEILTATENRLQDAPMWKVPDHKAGKPWPGEPNPKRVMYKK